MHRNCVITTDLRGFGERTNEPLEEVGVGGREGVGGEVGGGVLWVFCTKYNFEGLYDHRTEFCQTACRGPSLL